MAVDSLQHGDLKTFGGVGNPYTIFSTHLTNGVDTARSEGCIPNPQAYMIHAGLPPNVMDLYGSHGAGGIVDNEHLSGIVGNYLNYIYIYLFLFLYRTYKHIV